VSPLLELRDVSKRFGGIDAVRSVSFDVQRGALIGLIGPNGAGKTTLVNLISKHETPTSGEIILDAEPIHQLATFRVAQKGISRTYQQNRLFYQDTVIDNVKTGMVWAKAADRGDLSYPGAKGSDHDRLETLLDLFGLTAHRYSMPGDLSHLLRRRIEIAQALAMIPKLLLLDEPFAGFSHDEAAELIELLRGCRQGGLTILLIDHNMDAVMQVCEHLFVMHHGALLASGSPAEVCANEQVINVYLGGNL
jgi:branched-chain amino acid transport system ATP-binding protein